MFFSVYVCVRLVRVCVCTLACVRVNVYFCVGVYARPCVYLSVYI